MRTFRVGKKVSNIAVASVLLASMMVSGIVWPIQKASAAALVNFSFNTTSSEASAVADYTFRYRTVSTAHMVWRLNAWTGVDFSSSTAAVKINGQSYAIPNDGSTGYWNGGAPYIRVPGLSVIPANADIEVILSGVINPATPGTYTSGGIGTANGGGGLVDNASVRPSITVPAVAPLDFTNPSTKEVEVENTLAISDLALVGGNGNPVYNINLYVEGGSLSFGSSTGLTFTGSSSGQSLQFSGTKYHINKALATLVYTAPNVVDTFKLEALINEAGGGVVWADNEHAYKVVSVGGPGISWTDAKAAAEGQTFGGVAGYLATITSIQEHNFVLTRINQDGWIGASDSDVEGTWRWKTGPEGLMDDGDGLHFWTGNGSGSVVPGQFANWNQVSPATEPNNSGAGEDCGQIRFTANAEGRWNDLPCTTPLPNYVVEFGAPGALPEVVTTSFNINTLPHTYTLSFDTQGGTDVNAVIGIEEGHSVTLSGEPVQSGYIFDGWNAESDGEGDAYASGDNFTMPGEHTTLYAMWKQDGNVDVIPDEDQDNVYNFVDPVSGNDVSMVVDESCDVSDARMSNVNTHAVKDSGYRYPTGFVNFTATGCDEGKTEVELYFHRTAENSLALRKYNPNTGAYFTIGDADLENRSIGGQNLVIAKFTVVDGGALDIDGVVNGAITDPVGLGTVVVAAPNTGAQSVRNFLFVNSNKR